MPLPREVVVSSQTPSRLDLTLARRGHVEVLVHDPVEDVALEGVRMLLRREADGEIAELATGSDGTCRFQDLRAGSYTISAQAPAGFRCRTPDQAVSVTPGAALELEFELERAGIVRGRVMDEDTQEPLVGVTVRLYNAAGSFVREVKTVADGVYEFTNLPEDRYEVEVEQ